MSSLSDYLDWADRAEREASEKLKRKAQEIAESKDEIRIQQERLVRLKNENHDRLQLQHQRKVPEVVECKEEIRAVRKRLARLKQENHQLQLTTELKVSGGTAWVFLSEDNKWKKANVLAVLASGKLPKAMTEVNWKKVPEHIRDDRDILLARLERKGFSQHYRKSNSPFRVPEQFLSDKQVMLKVILRYPEVLDQDVLPDNLLNDADIFSAFLRSDIMSENSPRKTAMEKALSKFSNEIRGNSELMLAAIQWTPFALEVLSAKLRDDRSFALNAANLASLLPGSVLRYFSRRLRHDRKVVLAFVKSKGLWLKDAGYAVRGDLEVVRAACENDPLALLYCKSGHAKKELTSDKNFMLDIHRRVNLADARLWEMLAMNLKHDRDLSFYALKNKCAEIDDIAAEVAGDRSFWLDSIEKDASFWYMLPEQFANNPDFARKIRCFDIIGMVHDVTDRFPALSSDRQVWMNIVHSAFDSSLHHMLRDVASAEIRGDREIMLEACRRNSEVLQILDAPLVNDRDFLDTLLESSPAALMHVPIAAQRMCPDLVVKVFRRGIDWVWKNGRHDGSFVAFDLWSNRDVVTAWLSSGGDYLSGVFPEAYRDDKELFLLVAENSRRIPSFWEASKRLRADKQFMLQAVEKNSCAFLYAHGSLQKDFDLALLALATSTGTDYNGSTGFLDHFLDHLVYDGPNVEKLHQEIQDKLKARDNFVKGILYGMSAHAGPRCPLPVLNQGAETSLAFKKLVAEYLGVPTGRELRLLRLAKEPVTFLLEDYYERYNDYFADEEEED